MNFFVAAIAARCYTWRHGVAPRPRSARHPVTPPAAAPIAAPHLIRAMLEGDRSLLRLWQCLPLPDPSDRAGVVAAGVQTARATITAMIRYAATRRHPPPRDADVNALFASVNSPVRPATGSAA